eukprot:CAMPEP_0177648582 /NCGR_PEP_ID=MMETSP0447-20121125/10904_1 /TAXON_ID=0 /ORGANISM="Stygamoeba regulata, Strain BSH-02190019" /LENGTH=265 /DNA_ID=CAMNT_0019151231 /DNA_START=176 /DNA_END=970 /DNA_ORIENTATION=+
MSLSPFDNLARESVTLLARCLEARNDSSSSPSGTSGAMQRRRLRSLRTRYALLERYLVERQTQLARRRARLGLSSPDGASVVQSTSQSAHDFASASSSSEPSRRLLVERLRGLRTEAGERSAGRHAQQLLLQRVEEAALLLPVAAQLPTTTATLPDGDVRGGRWAHRCARLGELRAALQRRERAYALVMQTQRRLDQVRVYKRRQVRWRVQQAARRRATERVRSSSGGSALEQDDDDEAVEQLCFAAQAHLLASGVDCNSSRVGR